MDRIEIWDGQDRDMRIDRIDHMRMDNIILATAWAKLKQI